MRRKGGKGFLASRTYAKREQENKVVESVKGIACVQRLGVCGMVSQGDRVCTLNLNPANSQMSTQSYSRSSTDKECTELL